MSRTTTRAATQQAIDQLLSELAATGEVRERFTYPGLFKRPVWTDLVIIPAFPGDRVVIATEREDNPGASITNTIELLAAALSSETGWLAHDFHLVEHYPENRTLGRSLDLVTFARMWSGPRWQHLTIPALSALIRGSAKGLDV